MRGDRQIKELEEQVMDDHLINGEISMINILFPKMGHKDHVLRLYFYSCGGGGWWLFMPLICKDISTLCCI